MNYFVKGNPDLCIGCRTCLIGCVVAHEGLHIFEVDPDSYTFNPKLHMVKTSNLTVPIQCKHCESPACMAACPKGCITMHDHTVIIDTANCIGCKACMDACPFGAIDMVPVANVKQIDGSDRMVANKCDLCTGVEGGPACVRVCPTEALKLVKEDSMEETLIRRRLETAKTMALTNPEKEEA